MLSRRLPFFCLFNIWRRRTPFIYLELKNLSILRSILMFCRQKLLYAGLKKNIQIEELLACLGLGSGSLVGVSSLMNLVMQFRKVCNHPELFERREPKSPFIFSLPPLSIPRLLLQDKPNPVSESPKFTVRENC